MKKLTIILAMAIFGFSANAQTSKSKAKNGTTKVKHKTSASTLHKASPSVNTVGSGRVTSETMSGTVPGAALPSTSVRIYDSTYYDGSRYNPYRKFTPGETAPEDPAPGLENAGAPRKRLPNTDELTEPRK